MTKTEDLIEHWRQIGPAEWAESPWGWIMATGDPIELEEWQRALLAAWWERRDVVMTLCISNIKKVGKTTLNALLTAWRWLVLPGEHFIAANDRDQSVGRQFAMIDKMAERNPILENAVHQTRTLLTFEPTGSTLEALEVDAAGRAGAPELRTVSHTEAWGIQTELARRAWEELTPPPDLCYGLPALRIADSYAGWEGESEVWHELVDRGLAGDPIGDDWPLYQTGGLLLFHMEGIEAQERCFRGADARQAIYYEDQRQELRGNTFKRLHLNQRTQAEGAFIEAADWDALLVDDYRCPGPGADVMLTVGLDLAPKHDYAAAVSIWEIDDQDEGQWLALGPYRIWRPGRELDFTAVEEWLAKLAQDYYVRSVVFDPYQATYMMQRLREQGLNVTEYPQTVGRLTEAGNALYDAIKQRRLVVYPGSDQLRRHVLAASAKETDRGLRLVKGSGGHKIDAAVALAMAVVSADPMANAPWAILV